MEQEIHQFKEVRDWLEWTLAEKVKKNPRYSLRAFSKTVGLSPSFLSRVLSGQRTLSLKAALKLANALDLNPMERKALLEKSLGDIPKLQDKVSDDYHEITKDTFAVISQWHHFAIAQLLNIKGFKEDNKWIARELGIAPLEVKFAIDRLLRLGMLKRDENGKLLRSHENLSVKSEMSPAIRIFQRQILEKAIESLSVDPIKERDITSITMAIDEKNIPKAKLEIEKFRKRLSTLLEKGKKTRVYNLGIHLIPLSRKQK